MAARDRIPPPSVFSEKNPHFLCLSKNTHNAEPSTPQIPASQARCDPSCSQSPGPAATRMRTSVPVTSRVEHRARTPVFVSRPPYHRALMSGGARQPTSPQSRGGGRPLLRLGRARGAVRPRRIGARIGSPASPLASTSASSTSPATARSPVRSGHRPPSRRPPVRSPTSRASTPPRCLGMGSGQPWCLSSWWTYSPAGAQGCRRRGPAPRAPLQLAPPWGLERPTGDRA